MRPFLFPSALLGTLLLLPSPILAQAVAADPDKTATTAATPNAALSPDAGAPPDAGAAPDAVAASEPIGAEQKPRSVTLDDGIVLTVAPMRSTNWTSLRFVVKAGSRQDPMGKEGLAHLVEHLIFQQMPERDTLLDAVRAAGAEANAFTSAESTIFELDAPAAAFPALAERFIARVTDPSLELSKLDRENRVIETEVEYHSGTNALTMMIEDALFTRDTRPVGGTKASRSTIENKDVIGFFNRFYTTQNIAVVFAGGIGFEEARTILEKGMRMPPTMPEEAARIRARNELPTLPYSQKVRAPRTLVVHGYLLDEKNAGACDALADIVGLRLTLETEADETLPATQGVACVRMHGSQFLFAHVYTSSLNGSGLADLMKRVFSRARLLKPSKREELTLGRRAVHRRWRIDSNPAATADELAHQTIRGSPSAAPAVGAPEAAPMSLDAVAAQTFVDERQVILQFSPFEG